MFTVSLSVLSSYVLCFISDSSLSHLFHSFQIFYKTSYKVDCWSRYCADMQPHLLVRLLVVTVTWQIQTHVHKVFVFVMCSVPFQSGRNMRSLLSLDPIVKLILRGGWCCWAKPLKENNVPYFTLLYIIWKLVTETFYLFMVKVKDDQHCPENKMSNIVI